MEQITEFRKNTGEFTKKFLLHLINICKNVYKINGINHRYIVIIYDILKKMHVCKISDNNLDSLLEREYELTYLKTQIKAICNYESYCKLFYPLKNIFNDVYITFLQDNNMDKNIIEQNAFFAIHYDPQYVRHITEIEKQKMNYEFNNNILKYIKLYCERNKIIFKKPSVKEELFDFLYCGIISSNNYNENDITKIKNAFSTIINDDELYTILEYYGIELKFIYYVLQKNHPDFISYNSKYKKYSPEMWDQYAYYLLKHDDNYAIYKNNSSYTGFENNHHVYIPEHIWT